jgi:hypothetical protein
MDLRMKSDVPLHAAKGPVLVRARSAKGAVVRRQTREELASSPGGAPDTAPVLREFLKSAKGAAARHQTRAELSRYGSRTPVLVRLAIRESAPVQPNRHGQKYRRIFALSGVLVLTLLGVSLFHYLPSQQHLRKPFGRPARSEIAHLGVSRNPVATPSPLTVKHTIAVVSPPPEPSLKTPVSRPVTGLHLPLTVPNAAVATTKPIDVPPPDIASIPSPDRYALDGSLTGLPVPLAPPMSPASAPTVTGTSSAKTSADTSAVLEALEKYSNAWSSRRVAQITALRPGLPRRTVQEELSSTSSITMHIQPTSAPRIQGNRATVECIHQVDQVFTDGIKKQNPGIKMTYVLVRRGASWLIEEPRSTMR